MSSTTHTLTHKKKIKYIFIYNKIRNFIFQTLAFKVDYSILNMLTNCLFFWYLYEFYKTSN